MKNKFLTTLHFTQAKKCLNGIKNAIYECKVLYTLLYITLHYYYIELIF